MKVERLISTGFAVWMMSLLGLLSAILLELWGIHAVQADSLIVKVFLTTSTLGMGMVFIGVVLEGLKK